MAINTGRKPYRQLNNNISLKLGSKLILNHLFSSNIKIIDALLKYFIFYCVDAQNIEAKIIW